MKNTIAEEFNHNFDNGPFRLYDNRANNIYYETLNNFWTKRKFDNNHNMIYYENSKEETWLKTFK